MDTADDIPSIGTISLREALKRVDFEVLKPYLHTSRIPVRHRGMYTSDGGVWSGPGDIPSVWWANAYKDPFERVFFIVETVGDGRIIQETTFAYTIDIHLDRAAFEVFFPVATGPAESGDMRAAQESTPEQNVEVAATSEVPQVKKGATAGAKESILWTDIVPHLKTLFPSDQLPPTKNASFLAVKEWLFTHKKELSDSAIRKGIERHFPTWVAAWQS